MELWDLYDIDRIPLGRTMVRGEPVEEGTFFTVVHICIFNARGEMLVQQRQPFKSGWSGLWDITVGGSAVSGENSRQGAHRELLEELGIDRDFTAVRPAITINIERAFDDFYLLDGEYDPSQLRLQPEEVKAARWASLADIYEMIDAGTFIPYHKSFIALLFDMHGNGRIRSRRDFTTPAPR